MSGRIEEAISPETSLRMFRILPWFNMQIVRLGDGLDPDLSLGGPEAAESFRRWNRGT
jgi:hypothetical protein